MTAGAPSPALLLPSQVAELLQTVVKGLRAFQMYLPNNPVHQRAAVNVKNAFGPIWSAVRICCSASSRLPSSSRYRALMHRASGMPGLISRARRKHSRAAGRLFSFK